jgi:hypothetical protein
VVAAIEHNNNLSRKPDESLTGTLKYHRQYSKRSKNFRAAVISEGKSYDYWPSLTTRILQKRILDKSNMLKKSKVDAEHPKMIAPTIAMKEPPKTSDLVQAALPRFSKSSSGSPESSSDANEAQASAKQV